MADNPNFSGTFQEGAPISASQLQSLVTYVNQLNASTISLPTQFGSLAATAISQKMTSGTHNVGTIDLSKTYKEIAVTFDPPLTADPSSVQITLETTSTDSEIIHFIKGGTAKAGGVTVVLTRSIGALGKAISSPASVKLHYFAMAKPS
jgi:hypothetical protein